MTARELVESIVVGVGFGILLFLAIIGAICLAVMMAASP